MVTKRVRLAEIAAARSGDKGADANIGIWTDRADVYDFLRRELTSERVRTHFAALCRGEVHRHELPNLKALNFILGDALDGGGATSLRTDAQGKTLALGLLQMEVDVPAELLS